MLINSTRARNQIFHEINQRQSKTGASGQQDSGIVDGQRTVFVRDDGIIMRTLSPPTVSWLRQSILVQHSSLKEWPSHHVRTLVSESSVTRYPCSASTGSFNSYGQYSFWSCCQSWIPSPWVSRCSSTSCPLLAPACASPLIQYVSVLLPLIVSSF